jgi:CRISPR system Cascade subunit CasE
MFLSKLTLNDGFQNKRLAEDIGSPYRMHQAVYSGFPRNPGRILFRLEEGYVIVQSPDPPNWTRLINVPGYLKSAEVKKFIMDFEEGEILRFRLKANPSSSNDPKSKRVTNNYKKRSGLLNEEDCIEWLRKKGKRGGFEIIDVRTTQKPTLVRIYQPKEIFFVVALFDGYLQVVDHERFTQTLKQGIGPEKAFGLGLLSVCRA